MKSGIRGKTIAIQMMLLSIFGVEASEKWFAGGTPQWFTKEFADTWLVGLPGGLDFSWYLIAFLETLIAASALISILRGEFLVRRDQIVLRAALLISLGFYLMLGFGGRISGNHDIAAHSFQYFTGTLLSLFMIERSEGRFTGRPGGHRNHRQGADKDKARANAGTPQRNRSQNQKRDSQNHQPRFVKNR